MKAKYRNLFFLIGLVAIVIMLCTFEVSYDELISIIHRAGSWFPAVVGIWVVIYLFNTLSWYYIIRNGEKTCPVPFLTVYKLSVSGFALNYATPFGVMGGEPYRILELAPYVGSERATSSVILYVMMHIFSHICFWFTSIFVYIALYPVDMAVGLILFVIGLFCLIAFYFFMKGYRNGMVVGTLKFLRHLPYVKKWAIRFYEQKRGSLEKIDRQIAELHEQKKSTFYMSFGMEFTARILTSVEIFFILKIMTPNVNIFDCIVMMSFTSLIGNIFFFSPMQLGVREGGFALIVGNLALPAAFGVYTGLITRVREMIWIIIGLLLMKVGNKKTIPNHEKIH